MHGGDDGDQGAYLTAILYRQAPRLDVGGLLARLNLRCGTTVLLVEPDPAAPVWCFELTDHLIDYGDHTMPAMAMVWPEARIDVPGCAAALHVSDFCAKDLPADARLALFHEVCQAVLASAPGAHAIEWPARYLAWRGELRRHAG